jgi:hypothetical protein
LRLWRFGSASQQIAQAVAPKLERAKADWSMRTSGKLELRVSSNFDRLDASA